MKKGDGSKSTIIIGPSKSVLVYVLHSLEYVLGLARFRVFVPKLYINTYTWHLPSGPQDFLISSFESTLLTSLVRMWTTDLVHEARGVKGSV